MVCGITARRMALYFILEITALVVQAFGRLRIYRLYQVRPSHLHERRYSSAVVHTLLHSNGHLPLPETRLRRFNTVPSRLETSPIHLTDRSLIHKHPNHLPPRRTLKWLFHPTYPTRNLLRSPCHTDIG